MVRAEVMVPGWVYLDARVQRLKPFLRDFFKSLWIAIDDDGRFDADPEWLRGVLFGCVLHHVSKRDVQGYLVGLHEAGLVRLGTVRNHAFGKILNARQGNKRHLKIIYPDVDSIEEGELFAFAAQTKAGPEPPPVPPPRERTGKKERMNEGREGARHAPEAPPSSLTDDQWRERLIAEWPHINIPKQLDLAINNRRKAGKPLERGWFVDVWLKRCSKEYDPDAARKREHAAHVVARRAGPVVTTNYFAGAYKDMSDANGVRADESKELV